MTDVNQAQEGQEIQVSAETTVNSVESADLETQLNNEKAYAQKQRKAKQKLQAEIDGLKAEKESARVKKMEEDGKLKELLAERDAKIAKLQPIVDQHNSDMAKEKDTILSSFSEEEREELKDESLASLRMINKFKTQQNGVNNPQSIPNVQRDNLKLSKKIIDKMTPEERKERHSEILAFYKNSVK
tara:strand:+ start:271 stop:828 length:558 start_codon:yes stop_codon:yes gene_type:complete